MVIPFIYINYKKVKRLFKFSKSLLLGKSQFYPRI